MHESTREARKWATDYYGHFQNRLREVKHLALQGRIRQACQMLTSAAREAELAAKDYMKVSKLTPAGRDTIRHYRQMMRLQVEDAQRFILKPGQ